MLSQIPKISVVIPLYNKISHIIRAVDSVLDQTLPAMEIIVVNDGSTDGGGKHLLETHSKLIRYIEQDNSGVSQARNHGIKLAKGDYIAFLDADDSWEAHFLEEIQFLITKHPEAKVFTTAYQIIEGDENYIDPKVCWPKKAMNRSQILDNYFEVSSRGKLPFMMSGICILKSEFDVIGTFPIGESMGEDQELFASAALNSIIAYSSRILCFYHEEAENRACNINIPAEECPFSQRLFIWTFHQGRFSQHKNAILDYTAAHLLHIASLNIKLKRFEAAQKILYDTRCRRILPRYIWWYIRYIIAKLSNLNLNS